MTKQKILDMFSDIDFAYNNSSKHETLSRMLDELTEELKEHEAVEPVVNIDTWECGNCRHTLEHQELLGDNVLFHEQYNYCPKCGKKVKWNE